MLSPAEWSAVRLTAELAAVSTVLLLIVGTPLAWWLSRTRSRLKPFWAALVAMPLVLPPTVIGFYLLLLMGPNGPVGQATQALGLGRLPFTFAPISALPLTLYLPAAPVTPFPAAVARTPSRAQEDFCTRRYHSDSRRTCFSV